MKGHPDGPGDRAASLGPIRAIGQKPGPLMERPVPGSMESDAFTLGGTIQGGSTMGPQQFLMKMQSASTAASGNGGLLTLGSAAPGEGAKAVAPPMVCHDNPLVGAVRATLLAGAEGERRGGRGPLHGALGCAAVRMPQCAAVPPGRSAQALHFSAAGRPTQNATLPEGPAISQQTKPSGMSAQHAGVEGSPGAAMPAPQKPAPAPPVSEVGQGG